VCRLSSRGKGVSEKQMNKQIMIKKKTIGREVSPRPAMVFSCGPSRRVRFLALSKISGFFACVCQRVDGQTDFERI